MPDTLTTAEFASKIKQRDARLASVPDDVLVRKVLDRRPELMVHLTSPPSMPAAPAKLTEKDPFFSRFTDRISDAAEGTSQMVPTFLNRSRELFKNAKPWGLGKLTAIPRAEGEALGGMGKGLYGVSTPGLVQRMAAKEDPAAIAADAAMMMLPSGEAPAKGILEEGAKGVAV